MERLWLGVVVLDMPGFIFVFKSLPLSTQKGKIESSVAVVMWTAI